MGTDLGKGKIFGTRTPPSPPGGGASEGRVSERLGHANISITLDTFSHAVPTMQADAAEVLARLVMSHSAAYGEGRN